jgi:hypothetical protein
VDLLLFSSAFLFLSKSRSPPSSPPSGALIVSESAQVLPAPRPIPTARDDDDAHSLFYSCYFAALFPFGVLVFVVLALPTVRAPQASAVRCARLTARAAPSIHPAGAHGSSRPAGRPQEAGAGRRARSWLCSAGEWLRSGRPRVCMPLGRLWDHRCQSTRVASGVGLRPVAVSLRWAARTVPRGGAPMVPVLVPRARMETVPQEDGDHVRSANRAAKGELLSTGIRHPFVPIPCAARQRSSEHAGAMHPRNRSHGRSMRASVMEAGRLDASESAGHWPHASWRICSARLLLRTPVLVHLELR